MILKDKKMLAMLTAILFSGAAGIPAVTPTAWGEDSASVKGGGLGGRYQRAALVAQVQIAGVHRDVDRALSEPGMMAISGYVYSAVSHQVWKGEANRLIAFRLGLEVCDKKLERGERYLIFASPDSYGRLQLRSCEAVVAESEAAPLLAQLKLLGTNG